MKCFSILLLVNLILLIFLLDQKILIECKYVMESISVDLLSIVSYQSLTCSKLLNKFKQFYVHCFIKLGDNLRHSSVSNFPLNIYL